MRRLFLEQFHKQIFPSTPITSFFLFLSYIVVTPLMIGFEKDFSCHSHLGSIRISLLFPFPPEPFPRNDRESGTLELYYLSAYCLPKILLLQLVGHRVIQISRVFCAFPMLQLPYQFDRSEMDRLNILMAVGHNYYKKVKMNLSISHGGVCIFMLGVLLSCDPMAYVRPVAHASYSICSGRAAWTLIRSGYSIPPLRCSVDSLTLIGRWLIPNFVHKGKELWMN